MVGFDSVLFSRAFSVSGAICLALAITTACGSSRAESGSASAGTNAAAGDGGTPAGGRGGSAGLASGGLDSAGGAGGKAGETAGGGLSASGADAGGRGGTTGSSGAGTGSGLGGDAGDPGLGGAQGEGGTENPGTTLEYRACFAPAGINRINVERIDHGNDECVTLRIEEGAGPCPPVNLMGDGWCLRAVTRTDVMGCQSGPQGEPVIARAASGTFSITAPNVVNLDLSISFPNGTMPDAIVEARVTGCVADCTEDDCRG